MSADMDHVFVEEDDQRQLMEWQDQQYEQDLSRAKDELYDFFHKCVVGMVTIQDVREAKENLKLFGIDL